MIILGYPGGPNVITRSLYGRGRQKNLLQNGEMGEGLAGCWLCRRMGASEPRNAAVCPRWKGQGKGLSPEPPAGKQLCVWIL